MLELSLVIVEDEAVLLQTLTRMLRREVREVRAFSNAFDALKALSESPADVVLSDIKMPGMDGLEMIGQIRQDAPELPIIIASAFSDPAYFQKAIRLRVRHFIVKPIDSEELLRELSLVEADLRMQRDYRLKTRLLDDYKKIVDISNIVSKTDRQGHITYVNDNFVQISGYSAEELLGHSHSVIRHPDMPASLFTKLWRTILGGDPWQGTIKNRHKDGSAYYVKTTISPIFDDRGTIIEFISVRSDVTRLIESVRTARSLEREKHAYLELIDKNIITSSTDLDGTITEVSAAFCAISGYSAAELIGKNHRIIRHPDMPGTLYRDLWETITQGGTWKGEIKNRTKEGAHYWVHATIAPKYDSRSNHIGYTAIRQDITDKKRVEALSVTDRLTGLYNRHKLDELLAYETAQTRRYGLPLCIILLDIDHFKSVNDRYGHLVGDRVLQELAKILRSNARQTDTVGRWGGEEFMVLLPKTDLEGAFRYAENLRKCISEHRFETIGEKTASFGISQYVPDESIDAFIERSDTALYRAKERGRNRVER